MEKRPDSFIVKILRVVIGGGLGSRFFITGVFGLFDTLADAVRLLSNGVFASAYILGYISLALFLFLLSAIFLRFCFGNRLRDKISYKQLILSSFVMFVCSAVMIAIDDIQCDNFEWANYNPLVETMPTKSLYDTFDVDYSYDTIEVTGYFCFIHNGFRDQDHVEVIQDDRYSTGMRVEVYYRGCDCELYTANNDDGIYISVWEEDYEDGLTRDELVYMYKNKIDLEYADRYAIEKVVLRTAYPEKLDISAIEDFNY